MRIGLKTRPSVLFGGMLVSALIVFAPLRAALGLLSPDGLSAREVVGPLWWGGLGEARVGNVAIGDVSAGVSPLQLLIGRVRVDVAGRSGSANDALRGALTFSRSTSGMDDVTAHLPAGDAFASLPIAALDLDDVSVRFRDGACERAEGRVTATIATAAAPQLNLPQQMRGNARCAGGALEIPLASAAGTESIALSIRRDGRYQALLTAQPGDPAAGAALAAAGFQQIGNGYRLAVQGSF